MNTMTNLKKMMKQELKECKEDKVEIQLDKFIGYGYTVEEVTKVAKDLKII